MLTMLRRVKRGSADIRALREGELDNAALTLARSFDDDPLFQFLLPDPVRRAAWLLWFHRVALGEASRTGHVWVADSPGRGAIAVYPPHGYPAPLGISFRATPMIPTFPTMRLVRYGLAAEWVTRKKHPSFPHLYVRVLGVDPNEQGRGLGAELLEKAFDTARELGIPVYLESSNPANLTFYRRFGLIIREEIEGYGGPPMWTMDSREE